MNRTTTSVPKQEGHNESDYRLNERSALPANKKLPHAGVVRMFARHEGFLGLEAMHETMLD